MTRHVYSTFEKENTATMKKTILTTAAALLLSAGFLTTGAEAATHTVQKGDTLTSLAKKYKTSVKELQRLNSLNSAMIKIDQKIEIGNGKSIKQVSSTNSFHTSILATPPTIAVPKPQVSNTITNKNAKLINIAKAQLGVPYLWAGVTPNGFDCSGFIYYAFNQAGFNVARHDTIGFFDASKFVTNPVVGDLLFFENTYRKGISHIGIYLGEGQFIHAGDKGIAIASVDTNYWKPRFMGYKRF